MRQIALAGHWKKRQLAAGVTGMLAVCLLPAFVATAAAQDGRFYVGAVLNASVLGVDYDKTVIVREGAPVAEPPMLGETRERGSASSARGAAVGAGAVAGYRRQISDGGLSVSAEAQVAMQGGSTQGRLPGTGMQRGENWPEEWSVSKGRSFDLTARLGAPIGRIRVYLLGGARFASVDFDASFTGCEHPMCSRDGTYPDFVNGTLERESTPRGWTAGGGLEWPLGGNTAIRGEVSYTGYGADRTVDDFDENAAGMPTISVPSQLVSDEIGVSFNIVRYF